MSKFILLILLSVTCNQGYAFNVFGSGKMNGPRNLEFITLSSDGRESARPVSLKAGLYGPSWLSLGFEFRYDGIRFIRFEKLDSATGHETHDYENFISVLSELLADHVTKIQLRNPRDLMYVNAEDTCFELKIQDYADESKRQNYR